MPGELLENARKHAEQEEPSIRAAALLRIARVDATLDNSRARLTLLEGVDAAWKLSSPARNRLLEEARTVAAAVSPDMLADIPIPPHSRVPERFAENNIVQTMLAYGHVEAAFDYAIRDENSFPFSIVGNVLRSLDPNRPESAARRLMLLRRAVDAWRRTHFDDPQHERSQFIRVFSHFWSELPVEEALAITRTIVAQATSWPDMETSAGYSDEIRFTSQRQNTLFQVLHILRHLDPALAQSLIDSHDQLAAAARRFPNGFETIHEEAKAEAERRRAGTATGGGGGGYLMVGDSRDRDSQRRLIDAARSGDFAPSIEDAIEKYREDTEPATQNYAPKEYWPSTGAFRRLLRGGQAAWFRGHQTTGACSGRRSSPLRDHRAGCRSGRRARCIVYYPNEAATPDGSTTTAELTGIPGWPDHCVDASKWRKCKRPPDAEPRRPPHSLSEVPIPASCRSPLDLQMRSCLECVRDFRALPIVPRELGCCRLPPLWRTT
jgi:hypothetical protein